MISHSDENMPIDRSVSPVTVTRICGVTTQPEADLLATEEPLEIRIIYHLEGRRKQQPISVTMRTPGEDESLAAGFLLTEGIIQRADQIEAIHACRHGNVIRVRLQADATIDLSKLQRHFYTSSSCGVCGKSSIDAVQTIIPYPLISQYPVVESEVVRQAPQRLRIAQAVFERTGGLHACALFNTSGQLLRMSEDVGRHNAMDKLIGGELRAGAERFRDSMVLVSGRASFELVQKALMAGIPILAAIGAPSSLAVQLAAQHDMTLIGFVRADRFNIYCGDERIC
ncbi:formate dehydrogenase accessory sulfurtransferase FdhD [Blastopirellula sp. J2-11]|uniref:formate dehydrogenase accessory sulfurtransferase FdhD n=1 Tax=Blastopirellula sp. J2-11 TaxID=2943192 RepID=UPI0021C9D291|nr:formate dehydrogenase accessory sulfurtransferase FdhD [Blastopirellula sp. J2-11]UUO04338.1 formate dehydrogenase accessory sulfurtransferase FdhD [Blastopirellula sp. J2-11]